MKVLEVNNIDLIGSHFNGYDMIDELKDKNISIKQSVIIKQSNNNKVSKIINNSCEEYCNYKFEGIEQELSIKNVFSITTPLLREMKDYQEADIIHFHMFHNTNLSLYSLIKIAKEKKVVLTLHDPWFITGRCVHFYDCDKWKSGCKKCPNLETLFPFKEDNCHEMWELKKKVFDNINIDIVVSSRWMLDLVENSPIMEHQKNTHLIPFGINYKEFCSISPKEARAHFHIPKDDVVLFLRAQNEFKGTPYVLEALKKLETKKSLTILTCDTKNLLDDIKDKYNVVDLGSINKKEMIYAMNACDMFLMPSIGESFGMMAIEAMSCKKPVIVFNNSALPSVTHAPECGYLVKNRDSDDLMKAMKKLIENKDEREKRGMLGFEIVKKEYSNETYNNNLKKLYTDINNRKKTTQKEINYKETENSKQFKFYLNDLTVRLFGTKSEVSKNLMYDLKGEKRNKNKYDFSDFSLQKLLEDYCENLSKLINKYPRVYAGKRIKMEKLIYFIKNNPKQIYRIIKK